MASRFERPVLERLESHKTLWEDHPQRLRTDTRTSRARHGGAAGLPEWSPKCQLRNQIWVSKWCVAATLAPPIEMEKKEYAHYEARNRTNYPMSWCRKNFKNFLCWQLFLIFYQRAKQNRISPDTSNLRTGYRLTLGRKAPAARKNVYMDCVVNQIRGVQG